MLLFCFFTKESLIMSALKQKILDKIKQSSGIIKTQKKYFLKAFCKFLHHKQNFCLKVSLKILYILPETSKTSLLCTDLPPYIWNWVLSQLFRWYWEPVKQILSIYLICYFCKWAGTVILLHILRCWDKWEDNLRRPLVLYQCPIGVWQLRMYQTN